MNFRLGKRFSGGGVSSIIRRFSEILSAYGLGEEKFLRKINDYQLILKKHNALASFSVTAIVIPRHPQFFKDLERNGMELTVQAFRHIDYSTTSPEDQEDDMVKAVSVFNEFNLPFSGFRAPYLKYSDGTHTLLKKYFKYNSGEKFLWDCALNITYPRNSKSFISVPYYRSGLLEIPVSIPSDIYLLHRCGLTDKEEISRYWINTLNSSNLRGELFTLQLHPENIHKCDKALDDLLAEANHRKPPVWIARLVDVADWWVERENFSIERKKGKKIKVSVDCSDDATILVKNLKVTKSQDWFGGEKVVESRNFTVNKNPAIGVSPNANPLLKDFLKTEGFIVEESTSRKDFSIYYDQEEFTEYDKLNILTDIESSGKPYARLWRWPKKARSVLSISGDIDCVTLKDYFMRAVGK